MAGRNRLPSSLASSSQTLHVVQELEEHDSRKHGQAVEVGRSDP